MKHRTKLYYGVAVLAGCFVAYVVIQAAISARLQSVTSLLTVDLQKAEEALRTIAATTARLGVDQTADTIISNCPSSDLASYNQLLGRLNQGLSPIELQQLDRDFGRCGYRNDQRRAILVLQFESQVQMAEQQIALHELAGGSSPFEERLSLWQELLQAEQALTMQFRRLTELQDQIIQTLLLGAAAGSPEIEEILLEVKQTRDAMTVRNLQLDTLRAQLSVS